VHSWRVLILPFIGQEALYKQYNFDEPWDGPNNRKLAARMPKVLAFSGDQGAGNTTTNYLAVVGSQTIWQPGRKVTMDDVKDGPDNTILIVENRGALVHWMEPRDLSFDEMDFTINSRDGVSSKYVEPAVAMASTSVRRLSKATRPATLRALLTIAGGENPDYTDRLEWERLPDGRDRPEAP
jgi:hypothetical protein